MFGFDLGNGNSLKILERHHAQVLFELTDSCRNYLREWLPWVDITKSVQDTEKFIEMTRNNFASNNGFQAGIWSGDKIAGCVGFHGINWSNGTSSLGYWLGENFQGNGLMTSSCRALIQHAFSDYRLNRIEIRCATGNHKSRAIPERLGFKLEGTIRQAERLPGPRFVDHAVYGMLASEWK
jgi:ribosomal-protein-serine acetyltransferase